MPSEQYTPRELTEIVASIIRGYTFRFKDEDALQRGVAEALAEMTRAGDDVQVEREARIDARNRVDFMVRLHGISVAIEVKVAGGAAAVGRQVNRYLATEEVDGLVLVTTRSGHKSVKTVGAVTGKPVEIVWLGFSAF